MVTKPAGASVVPTIDSQSDCDAAAAAPAGAAPRPGGWSGDTPPANRHYTSVDTLYIGYQIDFTGRWAFLSDVFQHAKKSAGDKDAPAGERMVTLGNLRYEMHPAGMGRGCYVAYVLQAEGVTLKIMDRATPYGDVPNVYVELGALPCLDAGGLSGAVKLANAVAESLGGRILCDTVSRVDLFCDLADQPVKDFAVAWAAEHVVTRVRKAAEYGVFFHGRKVTGFTFAKGSPLMLRVYDKVNELRHDPVKRAAWTAAEWGGNAPAECTRVEFQLRREKLAAYGIKSAADLEAAAGKLTQYLSTEWFRFTAEHVDREHGHEKRAELAPCWRRVVDGFASAWATAAGAVRRIVRKACSVDHLRRMAVGCLQSIAAIRGEVMHGVDDLMGFAAEQIHALPPMDVYAAWIAKLTRFEARTPVDSAWSPSLEQLGLCEPSMQCRL